MPYYPARSYGHERKMTEISHLFPAAPREAQRLIFGNINAVDQYLSAGGFNQAIGEVCTIVEFEPDNPMMTNISPSSMGQTGVFNAKR